MHFPNVTGKNIDGESYSLPGDLDGAYNVVVLAFTQEQQWDVNTWLPFLAALKRQSPSLGAYELPTLARGTFIWRRMIDYWMDQGISNPEQRATTITLYLDVAAFLRAVGLPNTSSIYTLLIDRAGRVLWWTAGVFTPEKGAALRDVVESVQVV